MEVVKEWIAERVGAGSLVVEQAIPWIGPIADVRPCCDPTVALDVSAILHWHSSFMTAPAVPVMGETNTGCGRCQWRN